MGTHKADLETTEGRGVELVEGDGPLVCALSMVMRERAVHFTPDDPVALKFQQ